MDETTFRQLLSRHVGSLLDSRTLQKGAEYLNQGRVLRMHYEAGVGEGALIGMVQGSAAEPYAAGVRIRQEGARVKLDSYCTCPMQAACKHVAATVLRVLRTELQRAADAATPAAAQLGAWKYWLDALRAPPARAAVLAETAPSDGAICGIILGATENALVPQVQAQAVRLKPGKRGGFTAPRSLQPSEFDPAPWSTLSADEFRLVAALRMRAPSATYPREWFELSSAADESLLETLLGALPCFFERPSAGQLKLGPRRALRIGWDARDDGTQKLALSVDAASPKARLLRVGGLWYCDPVSHEIGRVDGEVRLAEAVLRAPSLLPEQVPLLMERWHDAPLLATLPKPEATGAIERREVEPQPVLTLRTIAALGAGGTRQQTGCVRLAFDYAGVRLPAMPAPPKERRRQGGRVIEVVRDRANEIAALERLEETGLVPAELFGRLPGIARDAFDDNDFVLEHGHGALAGVDQLFALTPRLRDLGFRLESSDGFPFDLLDEPDADAWIAEIEEESGNPWFDLRLGIDIGGTRIDLLPVLHRLLSDPAFPLSPRKGEADDAVWLVPIDARRRVPLPLAKLRELIAPLLEWLQGPFKEHDGALRLRRAQAEVLDQLAKGMQRPWLGGERLRAELERQRAPREPALEPAGFRATLRGYQREGLGWLGFLADAGLGGILADDMGLGKTVQVLAHLLAEKQRGRLDKPALVIAPTSLVGNWRDEAARFAPDLSVLVVHGPERAGSHVDIPRFDIVITTYPLLLRDRDALIAHEYSVLVLDEAQAIKNSKSQAAKVVRELVARQRIAMTGTPLENHLGELWAEFDAVEPGLLGDDKRFTKFFRTPIEKHGDVEKRERLIRRISPLLLRRRKEDVLTELPPKTEIVRRIELQGAQRELYEALRLTQHERVLEEVRKRGLAQSGIIVLDALLKLRQACCDPRLVKLDGAKRVKESAKLDYLLDLLSSLVDEGRRVLVFSQFAEMLALIATALRARKLDHQMLTGDTPGTARTALVKRFQDGEVPLFLISLKAGGVGLNLTAADTVIHYDPWWNPAVEAQATDRAHRIGQDKPVFVYKLICAGTVEEKIQALQQRKADLAHAVLDGGAAQSARFEEADLSELFAPL